MDTLTKEQRRKTMQAIRSKGSKIETSLSRALWHRGLRFRKNYRKAFGKPDIAIVGLRIAIFCDSEFWHGYDWKHRRNDIKSNRKFWRVKIKGNIARDRKVNKTLKKEGWLVIRFWGNEILGDLSKCIKIVEDAVHSQKRMREKA